MLLALSGFLFEERYGAQSVSFARFCRIARTAGYRGVELRRTQIAPDATPSRRRELLDIVRGEGLTATCLTARGLPAGGDERDAFLDRYLELCVDLRCRLLKISSDPGWLRAAAERAQAHGVVLAGNNHVGSALQTVSGTRRVLAQVGHRNFGLLYDSAHLHLADEDYRGLPAGVAAAHAQPAGALLPARRRRRGAVPGARRAGLGQTRCRTRAACRTGRRSCAPASGTATTA